MRELRGVRGREGKGGGRVYVTYIVLAGAPVLEELCVFRHKDGAVVDVVVRLEEAAGAAGRGGGVDGAGELCDGGGDARHVGGFWGFGGFEEIPMCWLMFLGFKCRPGL